MANSSEIKKLRQLAKERGLLAEEYSISGLKHLIAADSEQNLIQTNQIGYQQGRFKLIFERASAFTNLIFSPVTLMLEPDIVC